MFRLIVSFFMSISVFYGFTDESINYSNNKFEMDYEKPSESDVIENLRILIKNYAELTPDEQEDFLSESGLTKEYFRKVDALLRLNWKAEGKHKLSLSNSTLSIPKGYVFVKDRDALEIYKIEGEPACEFLEAYVFESSDFDDSIIFQYIETGYISIDDWQEIDSKDLLQQIIQNTEKDNLLRRQQGVIELNVIDWIQEPVLDQHTNTVYWSIEACSGDEHIVNSVAIRLGRKGYEKITWVTSLSSYLPFGGHLDVMLRSHSFDPGYRYSDYKMGDKIAGYGIATLVAATVGGKVVKAGGIVLLLKKFGSFLFAGIAAVFYKFVKFFKKNKDD